MPLYEYSCPACKANFERIRPIEMGYSAPCPDCGTASSRLISLVAAGIQGSSSLNTVPGLQMSNGCCGGSCGCS